MFSITYKSNSYLHVSTTVFIILWIKRYLPHFCNIIILTSIVIVIFRAKTVLESFSIKLPLICFKKIFETHCAIHFRMVGHYKEISTIEKKWILNCILRNKIKNIFKKLPFYHTQTYWQQQLFYSLQKLKEEKGLLISYV